MLLAVGGVTDEEAGALLTLPNTILLHLSDEASDHNISSYDSVKVVFRQYLGREFGDEILDYVNNASKQNEGKVYWLPLGYGKFSRMPSFDLPVEFRRYTWTWMGSVYGKAERGDVVEQLRLVEQEMSQQSLLHVYDTFLGDGAKLDKEYSFTLYETRFLPIPAGGSSEQFRVWEAFEAGDVNKGLISNYNFLCPVLIIVRFALAGCIPNFLSSAISQGSALWPVHLLGFEYLALDQWTDLSEMLRALHASPNSRAQTFQQMQNHNTRLWHKVKLSVGDAIALQVCNVVDTLNQHA